MSHSRHSGLIVSPEVTAVDVLPILKLHRMDLHRQASSSPTTAPDTTLEPTHVCIRRCVLVTSRRYNSWRQVFHNILHSYKACFADLCLPSVHSHPCYNPRTLTNTRLPLPCFNIQSPSLAYSCLLRSAWKLRGCFVHNAALASLSSLTYTSRYPYYHLVDCTAILLAHRSSANQWTVATHS